MANNKDRKQKKKEAEAKLREHMASAAEVKTLAPLTPPAGPSSSSHAGGPSSSTPASNGLPATTTPTDTLLMASNPSAAAFFGALNAETGIGSAAAASGGGYDSDEEVGAEANNAVDNARVARLTRGDDNDNNGDDANKNKNNPTNSNTNKQQNETQQPQQPKRKKFRQEEMKLALERALGPAKGTRLIPFVDPHLGNAPDPFVAVQLKADRNNVPIPSHWQTVSAYLSSQNDRPPANIVPEDIKNTAVDSIRTGKNTRPAVVPFARAYLDGNPLRVKTHGIRLMEKGKTYKGKRWKPSVTVTPGVISEKLRTALGMLSASSPPPWIHAMQRVGCLPPSYPNGKYPGLNAAIPPNGQWGFSRGQWGEPVRKADGSFLFPAVQNLGVVAAAAAAAAELNNPAVVPAAFGTVPPRRRLAADDAAAADAATTASNMAAATAAASSTATTKKAAPTIIPMQFTSMAAAGGGQRNPNSLLSTNPIPAAGGLMPLPMMMAPGLLNIAPDDEEDLMSAGARLAGGLAPPPLQGMVPGYSMPMAMMQQQQMYPQQPPLMMYPHQPQQQQYTGYRQ